MKFLVHILIFLTSGYGVVSKSHVHSDNSTILDLIGCSNFTSCFNIFITGFPFRVSMIADHDFRLESIFDKIILNKQILVNRRNLLQKRHAREMNKKFIEIQILRNKILQLEP
nr:uncharacterized protein LOC121125765 [Lepeophtheirus salmonis]